MQENNLMDTQEVDEEGHLQSKQTEINQNKSQENPIDLYDGVKVNQS